MRQLASFLYCLSFMCLPQMLSAQEETAQALETPAQHGEYTAAIEWKNIESDLRYFDPDQAAPPLETDIKPVKPDNEQEEATRQNTGTARGIVSVIVILILLAILFVFIRFGGGMSVSLGSDPANLKRDKRKKGQIAHTSEAPLGDLAAILKVQDRRLAIILLAQGALQRAIDANGLLLQQSWTAREALQRLPRDLPYWANLSDLVLDSERVHFGGRDISESAFETHVSRIRPLYTGARA